MYFCAVLPLARKIMEILAHIIGYLVVALFILGGLGLLIYMVQLCKSPFTKKGENPLPWWVFWRP